MTGPTIPIVELHSISKSYEDNQVLSEVTVALQEGEIHAFVGENGAGKSTLMKILFGLIQPSSGKIKFKGREIELRNSKEAKELGIGMVHQHFLLAPQLSVVDHLILEFPKRVHWFKQLFFPLKRLQFFASIETHLKRLDLKVDPMQKIENLPLGIQQKIELLKLLLNDSKILIFDEPTAVLTPSESTAFLHILLELKNSGKTIILISHKLKEFLQIADRFTVLRKGKVVGSGPIHGQSVQSLGSMLVKDAIPDIPKRQELHSNRVQLRVQNLSYFHNGRHPLKEISFQIHQSEILGLVGVEGNGQAELVEILNNPNRFKSQLSGNLFYQETNLLQLDFHAIRKLKMFVLPYDRLRQGMLLKQNLIENLFLGFDRLAQFLNLGLILKSKVQAHCLNILKRHDVNPKDPFLVIERFSGGNQQKFIVGKFLSQEPNLLVATHPTRGVDIHSCAHIHSELINLRKKAAAVLLISSDLEEILKLSDRILVIHSGKIIQEFLTSQVSEQQLGVAIGGGS